MSSSAVVLSKFNNELKNDDSRSTLKRLNQTSLSTTMTINTNELRSKRTKLKMANSLVAPIDKQEVPNHLLNTSKHLNHLIFIIDSMDLNLNHLILIIDSKDLNLRITWFSLLIQWIRIWITWILFIFCFKLYFNSIFFQYNCVCIYRDLRQTRTKSNIRVRSRRDPFCRLRNKRHHWFAQQSNREKVRANAAHHKHIESGAAHDRVGADDAQLRARLHKARSFGAGLLAWRARHFQARRVQILQRRDPDLFRGKRNKIHMIRIQIFRINNKNQVIHPINNKIQVILLSDLFFSFFYK